MVSVLGFIDCQGEGWTPLRGINAAGTMSGTGSDDAAPGPDDNPTQTPKKEA